MNTDADAEFPGPRPNPGATYADFFATAAQVLAENRKRQLRIAKRAHRLRVLLVVVVIGGAGYAVGQYLY